MKYLTKIGFHSTFLFLNNNFSLFSISIVWRSVRYTNRILGLLYLGIRRILPFFFSLEKNQTKTFRVSGIPSKKNPGFFHLDET